MVDAVTLGSIKRMSFPEFSTASSLTAGTAGTQAGGYQIVTSVAQFTTVAAGSSATLPTTQSGHTGRQVEVFNYGANALLLYPAGSDIINSLAASAAIAVPPNCVATCRSVAVGYWQVYLAPYGVGDTVTGVANSTFSLGSSTILTSVAGLSFYVVPGIYVVEGYLVTSNNSAGGIKMNLAGGTAGVSAMIADTWVYNTATLGSESNITNIASSLVVGGYLSTAIEIGATISVNTAGTIQLTACQSAANVTPLTIANLSYISATRVS